MTLTGMLQKQMQALSAHFNKYFSEQDSWNQYDWVCNLFNKNTVRLSSNQQDALLDLSSDRTLKTLFNSTPLPEFCVKLDKCPKKHVLKNWKPLV